MAASNSINTPFIDGYKAKSTLLIKHVIFLFSTFNNIPIMIQFYSWRITLSIKTMDFYLIFTPLYPHNITKLKIQNRKSFRIYNL